MIFKTVSVLLCSCGIEDETFVYYLLHCSNYLNDRKTVLGNNKSVLHNILEQNDFFISNVPLFAITFLPYPSN